MVDEPRGPRPSSYLVGFVGRVDEELVRRYGGEVHRAYSIVRAAWVSMPAARARQLGCHPQIRYVEQDVSVSALGERQILPWGVRRVFSGPTYPPPTWTLTRGAGATLAVLDTGIDARHPCLRVRGGVNVLAGENPDDFTDRQGHGTWVAGIAAALQDPTGVVGVAPEVDLYAVKVLDDWGRGSFGSVVAGIDWAVRAGIAILNMSLGAPRPSRLLREASEAARGRGHLLIAAAGNGGNPRGIGDNVLLPARLESVVAVAASDICDRRAPFSSTGPDVELIAPGVQIISTHPPDGVRRLSGTSGAAPHAAGAAALVSSLRPSLTGADVRRLLRRTAEDITLSPHHGGAGMVRADRAVRRAARGADRRITFAPG